MEHLNAETLFLDHFLEIHVYIFEVLEYNIKKFNLQCIVVTHHTWYS